MKFFNPESTIESLKLVIFGLKISGFMSFSIQIDCNRLKYKTSWLNVFYFISVFSLASHTFCGAFSDPISFSSRPLILDIGIYLLTRIAYAKLLFALAWSFYCRRDLFKVINNICKIDNKVINFILVPHNCSFIYSFSLFIAQATSLDAFISE